MGYQRRVHGDSQLASQRINMLKIALVVRRRTRFNKRKIYQKQLREITKICFTFLVNMNIVTHSDSSLELMLNVLRFASQLMLPLRPRPRLMLLFFMEDMDMVDLDMLDSDMPDLDMLVLDMVVLDTLLLDMVVL